MLYVVGEVTGVAQLGDIVYVICKNCPYIKMFTADTLNPLDGCIHVEGMRAPKDIVACHHDRQLYVADSIYCIWRVSASVSDGPQSYVEWLPEVFANKLSLTSRHLLVTSYQPLRLRQYSTTDGQLVHEVPLPSYVKHVWHAVETTRDTFFLCHRGTPEDENHWAVSKLSRITAT